jgi:hypothetical protein
MLNEKDIYNHLKNGGDSEDLYRALLNEISEVQKKVDAEKAAEQEAAVKALAVEEARKAAVAALTEYFALVNPNVTENVITSVLSTLESIKIENTKNGIAVWSNAFSNWTDIMDLLLR